MTVGVRTSASQPHSPESQESTMSPWEMISLSIWQTSVDHLHIWIIMQSCHLTDTDTTASHATARCSPALMTKVLRDIVNDAAHHPV